MKLWGKRLDQLKKLMESLRRKIRKYIKNKIILQLKKKKRKNKKRWEFRMGRNFIRKNEIIVAN